MPISAVTFGTPYYVLMDGNRRIGPKLMPLESGISVTLIYGFSHHCPYDRFCRNSQLALKPYPLVKSYLRNQADNVLNLVVVDAVEPSEPHLHAVTMEAVLEAQENGATHVTAAFCLMFDEEVNAYRVKHEEKN